MKRILKLIDEHFEEYLMALLMWTLVGVMTLQVFCRYVLKSSLSWSDEFCRYLFIWFTFVGISYCTKTDNHIKIDILAQLIPKLAKPLEYIGDAMMAAFIVYMIVPSTRQWLALMEANTTSPAMLMPMWIVYLSLLVGFVLTIMRLIQKYALKMMSIKSNKKEDEK